MKPEDFKNLKHGQKVYYPSWQDLHTYKFVAVNPFKETQAVLVSDASHARADVIGFAHLFLDYEEAKKEFIRLIEEETKKVKEVYGKNDSGV